MTYTRSKRHDPVEVAVILHHETVNAWFVSTTNERKHAVWVPKSLCEFDGKTLELPQWLAEEKGLFDPIGRTAHD